MVIKCTSSQFTATNITHFVIAQLGVIGTTSVYYARRVKNMSLRWEQGHQSEYLCAWGNDAASEVLTEARQLLVENYFQTPSLALVLPCAIENFWKGSL